jgi:hypothetical protein
VLLEKPRRRADIPGMSEGVGLYVAVTPLIAAALGAVVVFLARTRSNREALARSSRHRAEIDQILLDARIREAKQREAAQSGGTPGDDVWKTGEL